MIADDELRKRVDSYVCQTLDALDVANRDPTFDDIKAAYLAGAQSERAKWVSVKERQPEESGRYLIWYVNHITTLDYTKELNGWNVSPYAEPGKERESELFPDYWQKLPAAPEGI